MRRYVGVTDSVSGAHVVSVYDDDELVGLLAHHVKHSPDGFSWGYNGSGPAELARCLVIDVLGEGAWCSTCNGSGEDPEHGGTCVECWGEATSFTPRAYQRLKDIFVARLHQEDSWSIDRDHLAALVSDCGS